MSRNYESNGPDVKIRGNAGHIAEKYASLARDALSNGDTVMAENYLQHAEHYNRLIAAAQAQRAEEQAQQQNKGPQPEVEAVEEGGDQPSTSEGGGEKPEEAAGEKTENARPQKSGRRRSAKRVSAEDSTETGQTVSNVRQGSNGKELSNGSSSGDGGSEIAADGGDGDAEQEVMSDDAASLPDSITGGLRAEEA